MHPPPPGHVHPPPPSPQPEMLVMRKDEAVGNKKKMQVCLPKHIYKLDNNLLNSVPDPDPDPDVFGPPGSASGSTSQRYGSGYESGSVSFYHHAKIVRKTLISSIL